MAARRARESCNFLKFSSRESSESAKSGGIGIGAADADFITPDLFVQTKSTLVRILYPVSRVFCRAKTVLCLQDQATQVISLTRLAKVLIRSRSAILCCSKCATLACSSAILASFPFTSVLTMSRPRSMPLMRNA